MAHTTIRRALKQLIVEGLLAAEPRRGFRVLPRSNDPARGCPVAYISDPVVGASRPMQPWLVEQLRAAAERRGWPLLATAGSQDLAALVAGARSQRAFATVLNSVDPRLLAAVESWGAPAVVINDQAETTSIDSVVQDGHQGGVLAVRHLVKLGRRRIAWFGPGGTSVHALERFGGVAAALQGYADGLHPDLVFRVRANDCDGRAREILSRRDRPDGIVCLWREPGLAISRAAAALGLELGRELDVVGWCPEEQYEAAWLAEFRGRPAPPAITWSVRDMAELALSRLAERRESPGLPGLRVKIPVRLRLAEDS